MKVLTFLLVVVTGISSLAWADDYYWIDPAGGELGDGTKWDQGVTPGVDDNVFFTEPASYTVWLDDSYTHDRMTVEGSDLTLDLNGFTYTLDSTNDYNQAVIIGDTTTGSVTVRNGGIISHDLFLARKGDDSVGRLDLSGAGTSWVGFDGNHYSFFYGTAGDAEVSVTDNAYLFHGYGQSGILIQGSALFNIDGQDSEWSVSGTFEMSAYGKTTTNVSNGGRVGMGLLKMATYRGSEATIHVTGTGHESELAIENNWTDPVGLFIGVAGKGIINLTGSKLYHSGNTVIAERAGSEGRLNIYDGSWADCLGSVAVGGSLEQAGGRGLIYLYDDPQNDIYADLSCALQESRFLVVWPDGTVHMDGGELSTIYDHDSNLANPINLQGGTLEGGGWIRAYVNNYGGIVMPGAQGSGYNDWKLLDISFDYSQDAEATLKIPIAGTSSGGWSYWNYGGLNVGGQVTLDGFLDVDLWDNYSPAYAEEYVIIEAQSVSGQFINAASEYVFEGGKFEVVYQPDRVILTHFQGEPRCTEYPLADFNKDCQVNLIDLAIMAQEWLDCNLEPSGYCPGMLPM